MGGTCQRHFIHGIPRAAVAGERVSLTFRWLWRPVRGWMTTRERPTGGTAWRSEMLDEQ